MEETLSKVIIDCSKYPDKSLQNIIEENKEEISTDSVIVFENYSQNNARVIDNLDRLYLRNVTFNHCYFFNVSFNQCELEKVVFEECSLGKMKFNNCYGYLSSTSYFSSCTFDIIQINFCKFSGLSFINSTGKYTERKITIKNSDIRYISSRNSDSNLSNLDVKIYSSCLDLVQIYNQIISYLIIDYSKIAGVSGDNITVKKYTIAHGILGFTNSLTNSQFSDIKNNGTIDNLDIRGFTEINYSVTLPYISMFIPEGEFIGWKKIYEFEDCKFNRTLLAKLLIPNDAKRLKSTSGKCRASYAKVLGITNLEETKQYSKGYTLVSKINSNDLCTTYKVGNYVFPDSFNPNRWETCSNGIHFFMDKQSAIDY